MDDPVGDVGDTFSMRNAGADSRFELRSDFQLACRIGFAMAIVKAVVISVTQIAAPDTIWFPIFGFAADLQTSGFLDLLGVLLVGFFFVFGTRTRTLALGALLVLLTWLARYSGMGAFVPQAFYSLVFFAVVGLTVQDTDKDRAQLKHAATLFLFIIFVASGVQKINGNYLSGAEFLGTSGFFGPIHHFFGAPPEWLASKVLPVLSIAIELGLGLGLLWRPRLFSHLCVFFLLALSFLHTSALYAYLAILPLVVLIDTGILASIRSERVRVALLGNEYFWYFVHVLLLGSLGWKNRSFLTYYGRHWMAAAALIGIHIWLAKRSFVKPSGGTSSSIREWRPLHFKALSAVLVLVALTPVASWFGAPTPIGFTMFSGREHHYADHEVRLRGREGCLKLERVFAALAFTDVSFQRDQDGCRVVGPTASGSEYLIRRICQDSSLRAGFGFIETKAPGKDEWIARACEVKEEAG